MYYAAKGDGRAAEEGGGRRPALGICRNGEAAVGAQASSGSTGKSLLRGLHRRRSVHVRAAGEWVGCNVPGMCGGPRPSPSNSGVVPSQGAGSITEVVAAPSLERNVGDGVPCALELRAP